VPDDLITLVLAVEVGIVGFVPHYFRTHEDQSIPNRPHYFPLLYHAIQSAPFTSGLLAW